jgi:hypothetical protein
VEQGSSQHWNHRYKALNDAGVQQVIVGGLALNTHGFVRFTRNVNIVLCLEPANAARGINTLLRVGWRWPSPKRRRPLPTGRHASAGGIQVFVKDATVHLN